MKKIVIVFFLFISCNQRKNNSTTNLSNPKDSLVMTLLGKWGGRTGKPVFEIKKDSIHYFNEQKSYYYMIHGDDMIVLYKEVPYLLKDIHIIEDTIFFTTKGAGITRGFRYKD